jgi:tetratricopeptide (TPR) repeat protein
LGSRAKRLAEEGDLSNAILLWKQIEVHGSKSLAVLHNLALGYERLKDYEKAAHYWNRWNRSRLAQSAEPRDPLFDAEVGRRLGMCYLNAGMFQEAAKAYRLVLSKLPGDLAAHSALAELCLDEERWEEALSHMDHLQKNQPESTYRWTQIGFARIMTDDLEGAMQAWARAVELEPGNESAQTQLVDAL